MKILAFGEILYDMFDGEAKIGGAPLNFAAHFAKLGGDGYVLSSVGKDKLGEEAIEICGKLGVNRKYITAVDYKTGVCNVTHDGDEPVYDLSMIGAYDNISLTPEALEEIKKENFDIFYFGTLAQRSEASRKTLMSLLEVGCFKKVFFDMNLRQQYYCTDIIKESLTKSDIVKVNRSEFEMLKACGICGNQEDLCEIFGIEKLLVTLDKDGMSLYDAKSKTVYSSSKPVNKLLSAVGAGDASSSCFLYNYLAGEDMQECVERANIMGDYIVTFTEAVPEYSEELIQRVKGGKI